MYKVLQWISQLFKVQGPKIDKIEDIEKALNDGFRVINLTPYKEYIITRPLTIDVPNVIINGNNAIITRADNDIGRNNFTSIVVLDEYVTIKDLTIKGYNANQPPNNYYQVDNNGIVVYNSNNVTIQNIQFRAFGGVGLLFCSNGDNSKQASGVFLGSQNWETRLANSLSTGNRFTRCQVGMANTSRYEYSTSSNNEFKACAVGLWDESGNWVHGNHMAANCNHGFLSNVYKLIVRFYHKRLNANIVSDNTTYFTYGNHGHGAFTGFMANHTIDIGNDVFGGSATFLIDAVSTSKNMTNELGGKGCGVLGTTSTLALPPNLCNITLYFGSLRFKNIAVPNGSSRWNVMNVVISGQSTSNKGILTCDVQNKVKGIGVVGQNSYVEITNIPIS